MRNLRFTWNLDWVSRAVLMFILVAGGVALIWVWSMKFEACPVQDLTEAQKAAIAELVDIAKWILTLSVGVVGLFSSVALGFKEGPELTSAVWTLVVSAMCCFVLATYFALMWRTGVAEAFYNGCPASVAGSRLQARFDISTYFFLSGLAILAIILCSRIWRQP